MTIIYVSSPWWGFIYEPVVHRVSQKSPYRGEITPPPLFLAKCLLKKKRQKKAFIIYIEKKKVLKSLSWLDQETDNLTNWYPNLGDTTP